MNRSKKGATAAAADLTDDLINEILSRLPVKSVCRFKCVSWHWYRLISHPEHRTKLPQTISGFSYHKYELSEKDDFTVFPSFKGITWDQEQLFSDPSWPFLTEYRQIFLGTAAMALSSSDARDAPQETKLILWYAILPLRNGYSCLILVTKASHLNIAWVLTQLCHPTFMYSRSQTVMRAMDISQVLISTRQRLECGVTEKMVGVTMRFRWFTQEVSFSTECGTYSPMSLR